MAGHRNLPQCSATASRTGEQCRAKVIPGGTVCRYHGGSTSHVAAAADRRVALAEIERITERLGVITDPESPFEGASAALRQLRHMAQQTGETVVGLAANGGLRYEHEKAGEQVRGEVVIWQRVVKDMADLSLAIIRAGMDARLAEIGERQGHVLVSFMTAALANFGIDVADPAVHELLETMLRQMADDPQPVIVRAIEPPRDPTLTPVCEMGMHEKCLAYMAASGGPAPQWPQRCPCSCHAPRG